MSLKDDDIESNEISISNNEELFGIVPDDFINLNESSAVGNRFEEPEFDQFSTPKSKFKRDSRNFTCSWCHITTSKELLFNIGCTYECLLSACFYKRTPELFNMAYSLCQRNPDYDKIKLYPLILPKKTQKDKIDPNGYWDRVIYELYPNPNDPRLILLKKRLFDNSKSTHVLRFQSDFKRPTKLKK